MILSEPSIVPFLSVQVEWSPDCAIPCLNSNYSKCLPSLVSEGNREGITRTRTKSSTRSRARKCKEGNRRANSFAAYLKDQATARDPKGIPFNIQYDYGGPPRLVLISL
jgi:hypothetical protein